MGLIDRINALVAGRIRDEPVISVEGDAIVLTHRGRTERLTLDTLSGASAYSKDVFAGEVVVIELIFRSGAKVSVAQDSKNWRDVLALLDRSQTLAKPSAQWIVETIASGADGKPIDLLGPRLAR